MVNNRDNPMRHRDLLELIGHICPGEACNITTEDLRSAAEDRVNGAEGRHGLRAHVSTPEIRVYADGLKKYGVQVSTNPFSGTIALYKPQQQEN